MWNFTHDSDNSRWAVGEVRGGDGGMGGRVGRVASRAFIAAFCFADAED